MLNKKTMTNFISLSSVELLNFILPFITMPYLIAVLGIKNYGLNSFVQAVMQYFIIVSNYGFNVSATREISLVKKDKNKVALIYSNVIFCKLILAILCFIVMLLMILMVPKMGEYPMYYILMFGIVIGNVFFPVWFFQGIEEMKNIGILNSISKLIFTVGLFIFVRTEADIYKVAILNSLGYLTIGVIASLIVRYKYNVKFVKPSFSGMMMQYRESWHLFLSTLSTSLFNTTNIFVLGIVVGDVATGLFNVANTLIRICISISAPIVQTFYPNITQLAETSKDEAIKMISKIWKWASLIFLIGGIILFFFSGPIFHLIFQEKFDRSVHLIQIMAFLPLLVVWCDIFGMMTMTALGLKRELSRIYVVSGILSIINVVVLTVLFKEVGTAINALLIQIIVVISMYIVLIKNGINIPKGILDSEE